MATSETQLVINVENPSMLPLIKRVLKAIGGVSFETATPKHMTGIEEADEDIRLGRVTRYANVDELFRDVLGH